MQHADLTKIASAARAFQQIEDLNQQFLAHAAANSTPVNVPSSLQVTSDEIAISCFGHLAKAKPRVVSNGDGVYLMEYVFTAPLESDSVEVFRFYLSQHGHLLESPSAQNAICDFNNSYLARNLCGRALLGTLSSALLRPRKV